MIEVPKHDVEFVVLGGIARSVHSAYDRRKYAAELRKRGRTGLETDPPDPVLRDNDLLEEIDLLTELIAAAAAAHGKLPQQRIDEVLEGKSTPRIIHLRAVHGDEPAD